jgi:hypothetical protein
MLDGDSLKIFGMQNLMLETALAQIEQSGIEIGHASTISKEALVDVELFESDIRQEAYSMADLYVLYYCFENSVRRLISGRLREKHGTDWWENKVPKGVRDAVSEKQQKEKDTPVSIRSDDPLSYSNFGELIVILESNWSDFADTLRSKKATVSILGQFNQLRNVIAHSCYLTSDERLRLQLLVKDWLRIQT